MEMEVVDALAGIRARVDDHPVAGLVYALFLGDIIANEHHMAQQWGVALIDLPKGCNVLARNDQGVDRGLGVNIAESHYLVVLVDKISSDGAPC
jgi:hypothetical protein